jgi:glycosyltransferase involved in cell wall biosynthesis
MDRCELPYEWDDVFRGTIRAILLSNEECFTVKFRPLQNRVCRSQITIDSIISIESKPPRRQSSRKPMSEAQRHLKVSVILPTYRRFEPVLKTLEDLLVQQYPDFEIILLDQNPAWPEELRDRLALFTKDQRVHWVRIDAPGVVKACNLAVKEASGDLLLFVDDDVLIPHPHLLRLHARNFIYPDIIAAVGREHRPGDVTATVPAASAPLATASPERFKSIRAELTPLQQALWFDRNSSEPKRVCTFCTCNSSVRKSDFVAVGGFDELFTGNTYGYDADLALRLSERPGTIVYDPDAWLIHLRVPVGGLRLSDKHNRVDAAATAQGLWLFVFRHGYRGMYAHLIYRHVLRKTLLLRRNLLSTRQIGIAIGLLRGLVRAWHKRLLGPQSLFSLSEGGPV